MVQNLSLTRILILSGLLLCGCMKSSPSGSTKGSGNQTESKESTNTNSANSSPSKPQSKSWDDFPDVPKVEIMTDIDGIKIPRMASGKDTLQLTGAIPSDVGNDHAKKHPSEPVIGDTLTIRFNAEPKVLNPITETSAVETYIMQYVNEALARQNPETFEWEPGIAKKWIVEDSVKLAPDFADHERQIVMGDMAMNSIEFDYVVPQAIDGKPAEGPTLDLKTIGKDGNPLSRTWVGIYPVGRINGASTTGYHYWSDADGKLKFGGFPAGKYVIKTGDEVFGSVARHEDGSVTVTPATTENPLKEPIMLKKGEWQDIQAQTYTTFYLREDAKWSDGAPFTSKDVEFGYALLNSKYVDGDSIRTYYSDLVECTPFGPQTVRLRYRQQYFKAPEFSYGIAAYTPPWHFFENIFRTEGKELTLESLSEDEEYSKKKISAKGQAFGKFFNTDERYNSKPLGTGPYIVDKWERKDRVELVRNPNYWDPPKAGHLNRIIVKFIPDQVTAWAAMKSGEIDFFYDMSAEQYFEDWPTLDKETQDTYVRGSWFSPMFSYVGWNQLAPPFKDRRVRLALTMLFDRQDFIDKKLHGAAVVVSGPQYLFGPGYDRDVAPVAYDPETARELLNEAGWIDSDNDGILDKDGEKFRVVLRMRKGKPIDEQMCEVMQRNFKNVGIDLQIQTMEWASFIDKLRAKECDAVALRWAMSPESDPYQIWHSSGAARENRGSNSISFRNSTADQLIEMLRVTLDQDKRKLIHQSFHRLIDSEQPYMFLWVAKEFGAYHRRFRNVKWYRLRPGFDLSEWYVPKDEQLVK